MFPTSHGVVSQGRKGGDGPSLETFTGIAATGPMPVGSGPGEELGWIFEVGPAQLTVVALRLYAFTNQVIRPVRVWRVSDEALLGQAVVTSGPYPGVGGWSAPHPIAPIALAAGTRYLISTFVPSGEQFSRPTFANVTLSPHISLVGAAQGGSEGQFPPNHFATRVHGTGDIIYHL